MFFKNKAPRESVQDEIDVFMRFCFESKISRHKERFDQFSQKKCFENFLKTMDSQKVRLTCFLDAPNDAEHFLTEYKNIKFLRFNAGSEALSFLYLLDYISSLSLPLNRVVYLVEDDYLHREGWADVLLEGFSLPVSDYVTLYDHRDKYFDLSYRTLSSRLFVTKSCHWRTTPSTTHTFATRFETLLEDFKTHQHYSKNRLISEDHKKFKALGRKGRTIISSIPGFSTHAEPYFASPCINWMPFLEVL